MNEVTVERFGDTFVLTQTNHKTEDRLYLTLEQAYKVLAEITTELHKGYEDAKQ